jgi:hypothetical protein
VGERKKRDMIEEIKTKLESCEGLLKEGQRLLCLVCAKPYQVGEDSVQCRKYELWSQFGCSGHDCRTRTAMLKQSKHPSRGSL